MNIYLERPLLRPELFPLPLEFPRVLADFDCELVEEAFLLFEFPELRADDPLERELLPFGEDDVPLLPGEEFVFLPDEAISISYSSTLAFEGVLPSDLTTALPDLPLPVVSNSASRLILLSASSVSRKSAAYSSSRVWLNSLATLLCPS